MRQQKLGKPIAILLAAVLMYTNPSRGADCTATQKSLGLCQTYVKALENENVVLKQLVAKIEEQRNDAVDKYVKAEKSPLIPWWGWALIGAGAGIGGYALIKR